ncbi:MAG: hypothetical protein DHS20C18_08610 [Saprospiraceae bacterium]|nr:MAG: hypothetical protein DHS20C18_08610 [Saprospiraceae bacterium]
MDQSRLDQLTGLLKDSPEEPFLLFAIAKEYENQQNNDQALAYYLRLQSADADYVGLYYHLGKLYELMDDATRAFHTYTNGMKVAQKLGDQHALNELAGARLNLGDEEDFEE